MSIAGMHAQTRDNCRECKNKCLFSLFFLFSRPLSHSHSFSLSLSFALLQLSHSLTLNNETQYAVWQQQ